MYLEIVSKQLLTQGILYTRVNFETAMATFSLNI